MKFFTVSLLLLLQVSQALAQTCSTPGQSPSTAFPVCGTSVFRQSSVPLCGGRKVPGPCAPIIDDRNPFFYKFTCFETGSLGFVITPNSNASDYDWQLFEITGRNPDEIYSNASLFVACNWSGETGPTGASAAGNNLVVCEGFGRPLWSMMPTVEKGKTYLLLISHFSASQAGYSLEFKGGTAIITDSVPPRMKNISAGCNAQELSVSLSKKLRCSSLATNGSDFYIGGTNIAITQAGGVGCTSGFEMDSLNLQLDQPLPPGNYWLKVKTGSDGNTLLDFCDNPLSSSDSLSFAVLPQAATPMDSVKRVGCKPIELDIAFPNAILCSSISANGSEFVIGGPQPVTVTGAAGICNAQGATTTIRLRLSAAIVIGGTYTITLQQGTDGNTLLNECSKESSAGQQVVFSASNAVSVDVEEQLRYGCSSDTLFLSLKTPTPGATYTWHFDGRKVPGPNPVFFTWSPLENRRISFGVTGTNGVCSDSALSGQFDTRREILQAGITTVGPAFACPDETIEFADNSKGKPVEWLWIFGNGQTSNLQKPLPQQYPPNPSPGTQTYVARLFVKDGGGCTDTSTLQVQVPNNCYIAVPTGFTPNGDGLNDFLYPLNAWKAIDLHFRVYNRYGQLIWETRDWTRKWDGTIGGKKVETGTYVWMLQYTDGVTGKRVSTKGTTVLVR